MAPDLVRSFGIHERDVGTAAGSLASVFNWSNFFSNIFWGRLSDIIGRKSVMRIGCIGNMVCIIWFGVSSSLGSALAARICNGLLSANQSVARAMTRELTRDIPGATPRAFAMFGQAWGIGFFIGL